MNVRARPRIVLVGGGHAHALVLLRWAERPPAADVTVVSDRARAVYSGMVPGVVAGDYAPEQAEVDLAPLARAAGARLVVARADGLEGGPGDWPGEGPGQGEGASESRRVRCADGTALDADLVSFDVGSTVAGLALPGVRAHALATRPIHALVAGIERAADRLAGRVARAVCVGASAGGVELAFTLEARLRALGARPAVTLLDGGPTLLPGATPGLRARIERALARRAITLRLDARVAAVEPDAVVLTSGERLAADLVPWATGAAPHPWVATTGLPCDAAGFLRVGPTLEVEGHPGVFAAGDCAALVHAPETPKAGVYAVREAPVLAENLERSLAGAPLRRYDPQRGFLSLLNLGERTAAGAKGPFSASGRWVWHLKDRIDRGFMARFPRR